MHDIFVKPLDESNIIYLGYIYSTNTDDIIGSVLYELNKPRDVYNRSYLDIYKSRYYEIMIENRYTKDNKSIIYDIIDNKIVEEV